MSAASSPNPERPWELQVEDFALEVAERSLRLRQQAEAEATTGASELTTLVAALGHIAAKLEARCRARATGSPVAASPGGLAPPEGRTEAAAPARREDPETVARDMVAAGAGRPEVEEYLRRHFDRGDARRIARRVLRMAPESPAGQRYEG